MFRSLIIHVDIVKLCHKIHPETRGSVHQSNTSRFTEVWGAALMTASISAVHFTYLWEAFMDRCARCIPLISFVCVVRPSPLQCSGHVPSALWSKDSNWHIRKSRSKQSLQRERKWTNQNSYNSILLKILSSASSSSHPLGRRESN